MPKYWFDHVHLMSPDPVKTSEFYEKTFGAKVVSKQEFGGGPPMVKLDLAGTVILITPARGGTVENGLDHFGIQTDNLKAAIEELKADGVEFTMNYTEIGSEVKISFLKAPENVSIELQQGSL